MEETNYVRTSILADEANNFRRASVVNETTDGSTYETPDKHGGNRETQPVKQSPGTMTDYRRKTYLQKLKPWEKQRPIKNFWSMVLRPLRLLTYPVIIYCGFSYGCSLIWYSVLNATSSLILSAPPYNFSS